MPKAVIDFEIIESYDPRVIMITDTSMWEHLENKASVIEIILPGSKTPVSHYFTKNQINIFNSINLDITCPTSDCGCSGTDYGFLPDGVYEITLKASPDKFRQTKKYLHTANTRLTLDKKYLKAHLPCNAEASTVNNLEEIYTLIEMAEALVRVDDICTAQEIFYKAQDKLKNCE